MRTIVLCHGYTLAATGIDGVRTKLGVDATGYLHRDWDPVCIGDRDRKGRLLTTLQLVRDFNPAHVIFSTGSTWTPDGVSEARYSFETALNFVAEYGLEKSHIQDIALFDEVSPNTFGTIIEVAKWFREGRFGSEPTYLLHVASSNHSSRVLRDTVKGPFEGLPFVTHMFVPAETAYAGGHPSETIVDDLGGSYIPRAEVEKLLSWKAGGTK